MLVFDVLGAEKIHIGTGENTIIINVNTDRAAVVDLGNGITAAFFIHKNGRLAVGIDAPKDVHIDRDKIRKQKIESGFFDKQKSK